MSDARQFCPRCGRPVEAVAEGRPRLPEHAGTTRRRQNALCDACYFEQFDLVDAPDRMSVRVCAQCGAVHRGNRWVDVGARDYTDVAVEAVSEALAVHVDADDVTWTVEPEQVDPTTIRMRATFTGTVRGTPVEETVVVPVTISRETCTRCGRIAGDYYAGTVQVRATDRTPTTEEADRAVEIAHDVVGDMEATGDRNAFVTDVTRLPEGIDVKVSTNRIGEKVARRLVEEFGGGYESAETLVTEDEQGEPVYRVAFAVRLPQFTPGEIIDPEDGDGPVLVRSVRGNVKGTRLATGEHYEGAPDAVADARRLGVAEDAVEATLVTVEDEYAVQVLDPETYHPTTIPRPDSLDPDADTVRVLKSRAGLHVVPDA